LINGVKSGGESGLPGTSCPRANSALNSDFCLLVTEPTPLGLHDLKLAVATVRRLKIPLAVLNRDNIGIKKLKTGTKESQYHC